MKLCICMDFVVDSWAYSQTNFQPDKTCEIKPLYSNAMKLEIYQLSLNAYYKIKKNT